MSKSLLVFTALLFSLASQAATFTSSATGSWQTPATWTRVGADADGIPDADDDVVITGSSFTVTLTAANNSCRNFTINSGTFALGNVTLRFYGNVLKTGGTVSGVGSWLFYSVTGTIQGTFTNQGNWFFTLGSQTSIIAGSVVQKNNGFTIYQNAVVTNNGTVKLTGGTLTFNHPSGQWINAANSTLLVSASFIGAGVLNFSASPNTVIYQAAAATQVRANTYHHLTIQNTVATIPFLTGDITVNGNMTLIGTTLNCNNKIITLGGNWINNANTTCTNQNQINFTAGVAQSITRLTGNTEVFNAVNHSGLGTLTLGDTLQVNGLFNNTAGTFDLSASNYNLHCRSSFFDNAIFNARQGTVFFDGAIAQSIDGSSSTLFYNLTTSNAAGVSVSFIKQISNILYVASGSFGPSAFGTVILTATGTFTCARIAPLGATASLTGGSWSIQTFVNGPATAYWQYLGTPVSGNTLNDWDADTRFYMSGVGGNDGNACCPIFRSVRTYNTAANTYTNITSVNTALVRGKGYMIWMSDNMSGLTSPLVYDSRGTPNFGNASIAVVAGGAGAGYNLVSNPYACPINWASVVAASTATLSPNFVILQENGSYVTNPNGGTIAGGQGFMCVASTSANMNFTESCKSIVANPNVVRMIGGNEIRIKVGNQVNGLGEETVVKLNPGGDESLNLAVDLPYLTSPYDNATHIYTENSVGEQFLLNNLGTESDHLLIPLSVVTSTPGAQTITFKDLNTVTEYNCAWLEDLTTGARISLNSADTYIFNEDEMGVTRNFILHFERTSDCATDLQTSTASLDATSNVFVNNGNIFAQFEFETEEAVTISMYDLGGRMVMGETTMNVTNQTVALTNPDAHGIYLVRIQKGNEIATKKIYY